MIHTSRLPSSVVAIHNTSRHSCESDFILFLEKKTPRGAYALFCLADFISARCAKFLILSYMSRSMIHDPIRDPVRDPIRDPIGSKPVLSRFCRRRKLKVILGRFRSL